MVFIITYFVALVLLCGCVAFVMRHREEYKFEQLGTEAIKNLSSRTVADLIRIKGEIK